MRIGAVGQQTEQGGAGPGGRAANPLPRRSPVAESALAWDSPAAALSPSELMTLVGVIDKDMTGLVSLADFMRLVQPLARPLFCCTPLSL